MPRWDDDDWVGEPPEGRHSRDRADPGYWRKVRLADVAPGEKARLRYLYDFGDSWGHLVVVERVLPTATHTAVPTCTDGRRACPPEDCGGPWGYEAFLEAITDPAHEEHESMLEWADGTFDPEAFDPGDFHHRLHLGRLVKL